MERTISVEEKIRRAEEIYARRKQESSRPITTVSVNQNKKDLKLLKKMIIQIIICISIYWGIYMIQNGQYVFSEDFLNKANEILSYDTNFVEVYEMLKNNIEKFLPGLNNKNENSTNNENSANNENGEGVENTEQTENDGNQDAIGGAAEGGVQEETNEATELSQEEQDIIQINNTTSFIKPVEGTISSSYGLRENATGSVPKNHTGTDIAANTGTKIISATDGEVVLASEEGDYGKHLKIQIGEVSIIYAHCNALYVGQGAQVKQGQEIAEVGSTGNSTRSTFTF